jgi:aminopeptidase N
VVLVSADAGALKLQQLRFTLNDPAAAPLQWKIPVTLANTANLAAPEVVLLESSTATVPAPAGGGTTKANVGDAGYYRVLYDDPLADALRRQITTLPVADQLNLLADTWALVEAGRTPASAWLALADQLGSSREPPVLAQLLDRLWTIDHLEYGQPGRRAFQAWVVQRLAPQLTRLGWTAAAGESPLDTSLRAQLVGILGFCGDSAVIAECARRFDAFLRDPTTLAGDLHGPVLFVTGRYATRETYDRLHDLARAALTTEDKRRAYAGMQAAQDPALARETLALSLGSELSVTEATRNPARIAANDHPELAWDFARANLDALMKPVTFFGRNIYLPGITNSFTDAARADELEEFVRDHLPADAVPEAAKSADLIRLLAVVKKRELPAIDAWVKTRVKLPE